MVPKNSLYPQNVLDRFWAKVDKKSPAECWEWTAAKNEHGYGIIRIDGKNVKAHRIALANGSIEPPSSVKALHSCDNPPCVNPSHLRWGTQMENIEDMHSRGRRVYNRKQKAEKPEPKPAAGKYSFVTHCKYGHEFTEGNTRMKPNPAVRGGCERQCITCRKEASKKQAAARKKARHERGLIRKRKAL